MNHIQIFIYASVLSAITCCAKKPKENTAESNRIVSTAITEKSDINNCPPDTITYYYYQEGERPAFDDEIIGLFANGEQMGGYFWGTTDEFSTAREGYLPGFFVLKLQGVKIEGDSISFSLDSRNEKFFSNIIDISIRSSEEAKDRCYHPWNQSFSIFYDSIYVEGKIYPDSIILEPTVNRSDSRLFVKTSREKIAHLNRKMSDRDEKLNCKLENTDSLFFYELPKMEMDMKSSRSFAQSFFKNYATYYCTLQTAPMERTKEMRDKYLTTEAKKQFDETAKAHDLDGNFTYDLILDGYNMDRFRLSKVRMQTIGKDIYQFGRLKMYVTDENGHFKIYRLEISH